MHIRYFDKRFALKMRRQDCVQACSRFGAVCCFGVNVELWDAGELTLTPILLLSRLLTQSFLNKCLHFLLLLFLFESVQHSLFDKVAFLALF